MHSTKIFPTSFSRNSNISKYFLLYSLDEILNKKIIKQNNTKKMKNTYKKNHKINETNYFFANIQQIYFLHCFFYKKNIFYYILQMKH